MNGCTCSLYHPRVETQEKQFVREHTLTIFLLVPCSDVQNLRGTPTAIAHYLKDLSLTSSALLHTQHLLEELRA